MNQKQARHLRKTFNWIDWSGNVEVTPEYRIQIDMLQRTKDGARDIAFRQMASECPAHGQSLSGDGCNECRKLFNAGMLAKEAQREKKRQEDPDYQRKLKEAAERENFWDAERKRRLEEAAKYVPTKKEKRAKEKREKKKLNKHIRRQNLSDEYTRKARIRNRS